MSVQADDNLIPGTTYTFTYDLGNLFFNPSAATLQSDVVQNAPSFLGSMSVAQLAGLPLRYAVTFTYLGDGSDVASDVAASIQQAFTASNDDLSIYDMEVGALPTAGQAIVGAVTGAGSALGTVVGAGIGSAVKGATSNTTFDIVLVLVALAVVAYFLAQARGIAGAV